MGLLIENDQGNVWNRGWYRSVAELPILVVWTH